MHRVFSRHPFLLALLGTAALALIFALFTNHVWEDYYITYRSSRNLATGHGLVFNVGDRLHTFTSPLGVLLPALASLLTGNGSDAAALWLFRLMGATALGGAVALLLALARRLSYPALATAFLALFVALDGKSLDFSINGMETAFMLLFLAYALWAHLAPGPRQWAHLGAAWAGLMWTRPDSFIYIGLLGTGVWLFNDPARTGANRRQLLGLYLRAGLLTTALYGPWLAWATWYYGSPIPHTIVAKGAQGGGLGAAERFLHGVWRLPYLIWQLPNAAEGVFLPSYFVFPSWPAWMQPFGRTLATVCSLLWLMPRVRFEARVASFAFFGSVAYLMFVPYFPFPWYLVSPFLLAAVALGSTLAGVVQAAPRWGRIVGLPVALLLLAGGALTIGLARQSRAQQAYVETGNRRVIGEWLHAHAAPGDTVFMEPLGYIGYFSGLKTYDWPGMSSREVVAARWLVGAEWADLLRYLQPDWLVLRASGEGDLAHVSRALADISYERVRDFDRSADIAQLDVPGRKLLEFDSHFILYHRRYPIRHDADGYQIASPIGSSIRPIDGVDVRLVHAPGTMLVLVPPTAGSVTLQYGFPPEASTGNSPTDGADFEVWLVDGKERTRLFVQTLTPLARPEDRGLKRVQLPLPVRRHAEHAFLDLETRPRAHTAQDWTCWANPVFAAP